MEYKEMIWQLVRKQDTRDRVEVWTNRKLYEVREIKGDKQVHAYQTDHKGDVWGEVLEIMRDQQKRRWHLTCNGLVRHDYLGGDQEDTE